MTCRRSLGTPWRLEIDLGCRKLILLMFRQMMRSKTHRTWPMTIFSLTGGHAILSQRSNLINLSFDSTELKTEFWPLLKYGTQWHRPTNLAPHQGPSKVAIEQLPPQAQLCYSRWYFSSIVQSGPWETYATPDFGQWWFPLLSTISINDWVFLSKRRPFFGSSLSTRRPFLNDNPKHSWGDHDHDFE